MPIDLVADMLDRVRNDKPLHSLEAEFGVQPLASARDIGLSDDWAQKLSQQNPTQRQALTVVRMVGGTPASKLLQQGDLVLAIDGKVVTRFREVERAAADRSTVKVTVLARQQRADTGCGHS